MCSLLGERSFSCELEEPLPMVPSPEESVAEIQILSREPFTLRDQLPNLNQGSVGFLQPLGKQRLIKLTDISCLCTRVTVNVIGTGTKLLKKTHFDREFQTSLVIDEIEDGEIDFYIADATVNSGTDKLEIILHTCP